MQIPSAVQMAEKLIKDNPDLFPGNFLETQLAIVKVMGEYERACNKFVLSKEVNSDNLMDTILGIVKTDAKERYGIDLYKKTDSINS